MSDRWVIWRIVDGKPGHENQSRGLAEALGQHVATEVFELSPLTFSELLFALAFRKPPRLSYPAPRLILGAGHSTHWTLLALSRCYRAISVVLMKPSLPLGWFDYCIIPEHDKVPPGSGRFITQGVLNPVPWEENKNPDLGLMLIGGKSKHYQWSDEKVLQQLRVITQKNPINWVLTNSRRTPDAFMDKLAQAALPGLTIVPFEETNALWMRERFAESGQIWISQDSVSMVYESLSSGAACGLLELEAITQSRVVTGMNKLVQDGIIMPFSAWQSAGNLKIPGEQFNEANRCAQWLLSALLPPVETSQA